MKLGGGDNPYEGAYGAKAFVGATAEGTMTGQGGSDSDSADGNVVDPPANALPNFGLSKALGSRPGGRASVQRSAGAHAGS